MARTGNRPHCRSSALVLAWLFAAVLVGGVPLELRGGQAVFGELQGARDGGDRRRVHVRVGGSGPAVLLLHGFGDTGDMWQPLAENLVKDHTVIVPDLRGWDCRRIQKAGTRDESGSRHREILDELKASRIWLVTHDIGNMVGHALAAHFPDRVDKWAVMDAPFPGLGTWEQQLLNPRGGTSTFRGPDVERLVAGRERILLDRFYNELSASPAGIDEQTPPLRGAVKDQVRFTTPSEGSSPPSRRMPKKTRPCSKVGKLACRCWRSAAIIPTVPRSRRRWKQSRATSKGLSLPTPGTGSWRSSRRGDRVDYRILEEGAVSMDPRRCGRLCA